MSPSRLGASRSALEFRDRLRFLWRGAGGFSHARRDSRFRSSVHVVRVESESGILGDAGAKGPESAEGNAARRRGDTTVGEESGKGLPEALIIGPQPTAQIIPADRLGLEGEVLDDLVFERCCRR